ncbi:unnamed protein product, partial [Prorocentrum cordatum]
MAAGVSSNLAGKVDRDDDRDRDSSKQRSSSSSSSDTGYQIKVAERLVLKRRKRYKKCVGSEEETVRTKDKIIANAIAPQLSSAIAANAVQAGAPVAAGTGTIVPAVAATPAPQHPFQRVPPSVVTSATTLTAAQRAYTVAECSHAFKLESGTMEELKEKVNEKWSKVKVPKGMGRKIKDAGQ